MQRPGEITQEVRSERTALLSSRDLEAGASSSLPPQLFVPTQVSHYVAPASQENSFDIVWKKFMGFVDAANPLLFPIFALAAYAVTPSVMVASIMFAGAGAWGVGSSLVKWLAEGKTFDGSAKELGEQLNRVQEWMNMKLETLQRMAEQFETTPVSVEVAQAINFLWGYTEGVKQLLAREKEKAGELDSALFEKIVQQEHFRLIDRIEQAVDAVNGFFQTILVPGFSLLTANGFIHPPTNPIDPHTQLARNRTFDIASAGLGGFFGGAGVGVQVRKASKQGLTRKQIMEHFSEQLDQIEATCEHMNTLEQRIRNVLSSRFMQPANITFSLSTFPVDEVASSVSRNIDTIVQMGADEKQAVTAGQECFFRRKNPGVTGSRASALAYGT